MTPTDTISLDIDGQPVVFELLPTGTARAFQLWANGTVVAATARASLSEYGRAALTDLYKSAARARKAPPPKGVTEPRVTVVSKVRAYVYLPSAPSEEAHPVLIERTSGAWRCDRCDARDCEHVHLLLKEQPGAR